jgi:hypothetical protein
MLNCEWKGKLKEQATLIRDFRYTSEVRVCEGPVRVPVSQIASASPTRSRAGTRTAFGASPRSRPDQSGSRRKVRSALVCDQGSQPRCQTETLALYILLR